MLRVADAATNGAQSPTLVVTQPAAALPAAVPIAADVVIQVKASVARDTVRLSRASKSEMVAGP